MLFHIHIIQPIDQDTAQKLKEIEKLPEFDARDPEDPDGLGSRDLALMDIEQSLVDRMQRMLEEYLPADVFNLRLGFQYWLCPETHYELSGLIDNRARSETGVNLVKVHMYLQQVFKARQIPGWFALSLIRHPFVRAVPTLVP
jgi:hypothetical protein